MAPCSARRAAPAHDLAPIRERHAHACRRGGRGGVRRALGRAPLLIVAPGCAAGANPRPARSPLTIVHIEQELPRFGRHPAACKPPWAAAARCKPPGALRLLIRERRAPLGEAMALPGACGGALGALRPGCAWAGVLGTRECRGAVQARSRVQGVFGCQLHALHSMARVFPCPQRVSPALRHRSRACMSQHAHPCSQGSSRNGVGQVRAPPDGERRLPCIRPGPSDAPICHYQAPDPCWPRLKSRAWAPKRPWFSRKSKRLRRRSRRTAASARRAQPWRAHPGCHIQAEESAVGPHMPSAVQAVH